MEASACVASAVRAVSQPITSSQPSRKEWRIVSDQPVRYSVNEERSKLEQSDERLIYEVQQGREPLDVDFCSLLMDGSLDDELLQQRLERMVKQREELQKIEIELRARLSARSEIIDLRNSYEAQLKEQENINVKLQEQLHEREQTIRDLGRKMEERDRELHVIKLDNEASWAKEDLLREQNKELATIRRERDNSEAERAQHLKQIHNLQEHSQEKERQFLELQEQHRVGQETILFKDEQLREAQTWITHVQELDALHSSTNHSLQTELRERTEQYNQLWIGCQRQFAEMERLHLHTIQHLKLELADARERNGTYPNQLQISQGYLKDVSQLGQSNGNQVDVSQSEKPNGNSEGHPNGNVESVSPFLSAGNSATQADLVHGVSVASSSLLGMPPYLPPGEMTALHPFVMHQQGVPHSVQPNVPQSHVGFFQSAPAISSLQQWQNQQAATEDSQMQAHNQYSLSQIDQKLMSDGTYEYQVSVNEQSFHPEYLDAQISRGLEHGSVVPPSNKDGQTTKSGDKSYLMGMQSEQSLQQTSSQFRDALRLDSLEQNNETKEKNDDTLVKQTQDLMEETSSISNRSPKDPVNAINFSEVTMDNAGCTIMPEAYVSTSGKNMNVLGMTAETSLLDERSLLACIARTIPPGSSGRIRISTTLPNRLGKMLAPLTWNAYSKKYGKLDDFVSSHPELFVIEGDYIQLREGAQEIIAAAAAVAKVAAAAVTSSYPSLLPSVAVTPMSQSHRLRKASSIDSNSRKAEKIISKENAASRPTNTFDNSSQISAMLNKHSNGVSFNVAGGFSTIQILSKPKDQLEMNNSESRPDQSSILVTVGNGSYSDRSNLVSSQSKGLAHGKSGTNFVGKQPGRSNHV